MPYLVSLPRVIAIHGMTSGCMSRSWKKQRMFLHFTRHNKIAKWWDEYWVSTGQSLKTTKNVSITSDKYLLGVDVSLPPDLLARSTRPDKSETCDWACNYCLVSKEYVYSEYCKGRSKYSWGVDISLPWELSTRSFYGHAFISRGWNIQISL